MGLFSFTQEIAMDLGTANTIILNNGNIVVDEPSVVALDRRTDKMIAVGERAKLMYEKENPNIRTVRPLRDGVIADFNACEQMMRGLIKKVNVVTVSLRHPCVWLSVFLQVVLKWNSVLYVTVQNMQVVVMFT